MRILVVTGASGGHIFPALSFLESLKEKNNCIDTLLVLPKKSIKSLVNGFACRFAYTSIEPVSFALDLKFFFSIFNFLRGGLESLSIVLEFHPDIVVGFGSLSCLPIVILSRVFGIKVLIHEQNVIPGRANKFLARCADRIAVSFVKTREYLNGYQDKIVFTGNPLRRELARIEKRQALGSFGFQDDKFTVLVMGGSQGSQRINHTFLKAVSSLSLKFNLQIIHITGDRDYDLVKQGYRDINVAVRLFNFFKPMQYAYSAADLVVSRAGATTIAELLSYRLPAIIIPYPFAYRHQTENAKFLEELGCAVIFEDKELEQDLKDAIEDLIEHPERIKRMQSGYDNSPPFKNTLLADAVLSL